MSGLAKGPGNEGMTSDEFEEEARRARRYFYIQIFSRDLTFVGLLAKEREEKRRKGGESIRNLYSELKLRRAMQKKRGNVRSVQKWIYATDQSQSQKSRTREGEGEN